MKIFFPVAEAYPLYKIGGLGDVGGSLPIALNQAGVDVSVILPLHPEVNSEGFSEHMKFEIHYDSEALEVIIYQGQLGATSIPAYLVSETKYLSEHTDASDNHADKFAVFSLAVADWLNRIEDQAKPDLVHLHDWHTALIPLITKKLYQNFDYKFMLTIHNLAYQGRTNTPVLNKMGLADEEIAQAYDLTKDHHLNIMLQGIMESDLVVPVSQTYAQEILTTEYGEKLEHHLDGIKAKIKGIVNGIDYELFNPEQDKHLFHAYNSDTALEVRPQNKLELISHLELEAQAEDFLIGYVGRVDGHQKGIQLIIQAIESGVFDQSNRKLVFLGTGDTDLEVELHQVSQGKDNIQIHTVYDEELAIRIYSGADIMIIPSKFEPCGLVQMIAMRYGSIPVARKTGGLADTIVDKVDGFLFDLYDLEDFSRSIDRAEEVYVSDKKHWHQMVQTGMNKDFSWDASAQVYKDAYSSLMHGKVLENI